MRFKAWRNEYIPLLKHCRLPTLAVRRKLLKLCFLYQLMVGDYTFSDAPLKPRNLDPQLRSSNSCHISQRFTKINDLLCILIFPTLYLCGTLPLSLRCLSFPDYKHHVLYSV